MAEGEKKKRVVVESLGWLTESSIMPKKHSSIAGVGPTSILELKAQLYQSQEDVKKSKEFSGPDVEFRRAKKILPPSDVYSAKNSGVDARAHKDKLELKAEKDGKNSYEALERKSQLYEKLVRGELSDNEDKEKYCVDFFQKKVEQEEVPQARDHETSDLNDNDNVDLFSTKSFGPPGRTSRIVDNDEHKHFQNTTSSWQRDELNETLSKVSTAGKNKTVIIAVVNRTELMWKGISHCSTHSFTDTDVIWFRDPFPLLSQDESLDLQISNDKFHGRYSRSSKHIT